MNQEGLNATIFTRATGLFIACFLMMSSLKSGAQQSALLYEQTSEMGTMIVSYQRDQAAIVDFYSPYVMNAVNGYAYKASVLYSPEQRNRLIALNKEYLERLTAISFTEMSIYGQVDYLLLQQKVRDQLVRLEGEASAYQQIKAYLPFAEGLYALEKSRRRGTYPAAEQVAAQVHRWKKQVDSLYIKGRPSSLNEAQTDLVNNALKGLKARLKSYTEFYTNYDPLFTWWVPQPAEALSASLDQYASLFISKESPTKGSEIKGKPIGKAALVKQLKAEMIRYSPEELIAIAEKEFAFCDQELVKASAEMGFGDDWKQAQEKVKNSYVDLGRQPELIVRLQEEATQFIRQHELMELPALAEETWGMIMMTAQRQLVNPFFTGGKEISISYPTQEMSYDDRLMSMRGNNPYFSRGTVQHELLPGHHLQYYMNSRYKSYRNFFSTPFSVEGWPLYWELLLYEKGFAKTPEERIGMLFWRMHRCARILFSLQYHLGKWDPQQCVDFLVNRVGHERANAEGEVRRSFEGNYSPLYQVAYMIGGLQLYALKTELVESGKMSFNEFHQAVLKENLIPIEMIRAILTTQKLRPDYQAQWEFYPL